MIRYKYDISLLCCYSPDWDVVVTVRLFCFNDCNMRSEGGIFFEVKTLDMSKLPCLFNVYQQSLTFHGHCHSEYVKVVLASCLNKKYLTLDFATKNA